MIYLVSRARQTPGCAKEHHMTKTQQVEANPAAFSAAERQRAIETLDGMRRHFLAIANSAEPFTPGRARKQAVTIWMHQRWERLLAADAALAAAR
jgi:hypothetical protein